MHQMLRSLVQVNKSKAALRLLVMQTPQIMGITTPLLPEFAGPCALLPNWLSCPAPAALAVLAPDWIEPVDAGVV